MAVDLLLGACLVAIGVVLGALLRRVLGSADKPEERLEAVHRREPKPGPRGASDEADDAGKELELGQHAVDVGALSEAMRALAQSANPSAARTAVCEGARTVAGAPVAALLEASADGSNLALSASLGADLRGLVVPFAGERSRAAQAFAGAGPVYAPDAASQTDIDREFLRRTRAASALWHPVLHQGKAIGVLAVAWRRRLPSYPPRLEPLMDVLAAAAAVAIGRAELLGRMERIARTDELTGLANRRSWEEEMPREIARGWRGGTSLCVVMLDLDRFKVYNDTHGHQAGDRLLKEAAGAWRSMLRPYDLLARYGGEEFGVILPGCEPADALGIVERLRAATPPGVSCSAGLAQWDGEEHAEALVGRADAALYEAKRAGRDRVVVARLAGASR
jgi:diguanylate cyclase (GGDEF)-like protein